MADDNLNQDQDKDQTPEGIEKPSNELSVNDLEQVSGGMQGSQNNASYWPWIKGAANEVSADKVDGGSFK